MYPIAVGRALSFHGFYLMTLETHDKKAELLTTLIRLGLTSKFERIEIKRWCSGVVHQKNRRILLCNDLSMSNIEKINDSARLVLDDNSDQQHDSAIITPAESHLGSQITKKYNCA